MTYIKPFPDSLSIDYFLMAFNELMAAGADYEVAAGDVFLVASRNFRRKEFTNLLVPGAHYSLHTKTAQPLDWVMCLKYDRSAVLFYKGSSVVLTIDYKEGSITPARYYLTEADYQWMANEILGDPGYFD